MKWRIFLLLFILSDIPCLFAQNEYKELSRLKINFANGAHIQELYRYNDFLFALTDKFYLDYCVSLFNISDIRNPKELGRWDKGSYSGDDRYEKFVSFIKDTLIPFPFYAIKPDTAAGSITHYFWNPNVIISIGNIYFSFAGNGHQVKAFKISSNPWKTEFVSSLEIPTMQGAVTGIASVDNIIYLVSRKMGGNTSFIMVDASDPNNMKELPSPLPNDDLTGIVLGSDRILIGDEFRQLLVYDCSDPRNLKLVKKTYYSHNRLSGFFQNSIYYIIGEEKEFAVFDKDINLINKIPAAGFVYSAELDSPHLFLGSAAGIDIYNVSDIGNPFLEASYGANIAKAVNFKKNGNFLYTVNLGDGLKIIDAADSLKPKLAGTLSIKGYTRDIALSGHYAFLADYTKGLLTIDISDPLNPKLTSTLSIPTASGLDADGDKVFLTTDKNELFVINAADKVRPEIEYIDTISNHSYQNLGEYKKIKTAGNKIWTAFYEDSLYAFQYSNKTLKKTFSYTSPFTLWPSELIFKDSLLFLASQKTLVFNPYSQNYIGSAAPTIPAQITSAAYDEKTKALYTLEIVDWGVGICKYDMSVPSNPIRLREGISFDFPPEKLLFDKGLLYVLTRDELIIYSTNKTVGVDDNEKNHAAGIINYNLEQNFPNPFNPSTTIKYALKEQVHVTLKIYDILGREILTLVDKVQDAGEHKIHFDGSLLKSGIYIYTIQAGTFRSSRKLLLVK